MQRFVVEVEANQRLDLFLRSHLTEFSRSRIQDLVKNGNVLVNGNVARQAYSVQVGDKIELEVPEPVDLMSVPQNLPLNIVFEDQDLLIVNKTAGMVVHPAPGSKDGTLVNALLHYCKDLSGINGVLRPGIVHRLDKDTTGLMVVAKNDAAHRSLAKQLENRIIQRQYTALVWGVVSHDKGTVNAPLDRNSRNRKKMGVLSGGRSARTHYYVEDRFPFTTLLKLKLDTGRTHQIRAHMEHLGHPVFGDPVYAGRSQVSGIRPDMQRQARWGLSLINRQALHAHAISFKHPLTNCMVSFEAQLPQDLCDVISALKEIF
ncbi:MAG: RluA family pseudouridine synthase [Candidatus Latescibacterota bacterium]|nr:RluA family pseudouridine synthase [Candidatus Latescibacterota bacterium]